MNNITLNIAGLDKEVVAVEGGYGSGFFYNYLTVDLEELAAGNLAKAFSVDSAHDTAGTSFREYHGIDRTAKLPDGAIADAIRSLCEGIAQRAEELTKGFSVEWVNGNERAVWHDEDGDELTNENAVDGYGFSGNGDYWLAGQFAQDVADLDCAQTYDLTYSDNCPFVYENVKNDARFSTIESESDVEAILHDYYFDDSEWAYIGFSQAATDILEKIQEERADEESE